MLRHYLQCLAMKIVGLVGHIGAGKTSIAKFLESTGYLRITLSDFLIQEARAREVAPTRVNLQHLGDELRRRNGGSVLFKRALDGQPSQGRPGCHRWHSKSRRMCVAEAKIRRRVDPDEGV